MNKKNDALDVSALHNEYLKKFSFIEKDENIIYAIKSAYDDYFKIAMRNENLPKEKANSKSIFDLN